jgi:MFS family permease
MIGRKGTLFVGAVVFTVGGLIQTFTTGFWTMIVGRLISGFGVGLLSYGSDYSLRIILTKPRRTIVPIYQSEISPPNHVRLAFCFSKVILTRVQRGALACMEFTGNIIGYSSSVVCFFVYCVDSLFLTRHYSGRVIFVLSLTLIFRGGYLFSCNVSLGSSSRQGRYLCPKAHGTHLVLGSFLVYRLRCPPGGLSTWTKM